MPQDYVFEGAGAGGEATHVSLSGLFTPGKDSLVIYSFMFPRLSGDERPGITQILPIRLPFSARHDG